MAADNQWGEVLYVVTSGLMHIPSLGFRQSCAVPRGSWWTLLYHKIGKCMHDNFIL